jgi:hypothetical protein
MKSLRAMLMTLAMTFTFTMNAPAQVLAPQSHTMQLRGALQGLLAEAQVQCPKMAASLQAEKGKHDAKNFWLLQEYQNSLCQCQPAKVKQLLAQRPAAELDVAVTQPQALDYLTKNATAPCVGKVFRELLAGNQCKEFMDPAACACMAPEIAKMGDGEILMAGVAFQQYREALAKSKAAGKPNPEPGAAAPLVKLTERCSKSAP